jgi:hypothetical protein
MSKRESSSTEASGEELSPEARLAALLSQARVEQGARRAEVAGALNVLIEALRLDARPAEAAAVLHRLLHEGQLDGLEDERGLPTRIVAIRALLALDYPHALEVAPEQLEALRRWERGSQPVPWGSLMAILGGAALLQLIFVVLVGDDMRYFFGRVSAAALSGEPVEPRWTDSLWDFWLSARGPVLLGQLGANLCAFFLVVGGRRLARRAFLGLGAVGLLAWLSQLPLDWTPAWGTLASAVGSLLAARVLRSPAPREASR